MFLSKELYLSISAIQDSIKEKICDYCLHNEFSHIPDTEDIIIHINGDIKYFWEENVSCHCHPEYEKKEAFIKAEDFIKWCDKEDIEI